MDSPQFHHPIIFHQVMKYADEEGEVRMLIADKHLFKGVEITSLTPSSTKILLRLMRTPI